MNNPLLKAKIFTIFPDMFPGPLAASVIGDALKNNIWSLDIIDIRNSAFDARKTVDDTPYGGGAGMVMKADIIANAIDKNIPDPSSIKIIYPSPRGAVFNQKKAWELSEQKDLVFICGRYEGIDQRVIDYYQMEEISVGDYVLSGGELPAMTMLDAIIRNLPQVLGANESLNEESFGSARDLEYESLLEYPHYTKPQNWRGLEVPKILLSGHHKNIAAWRLQQAKELTKKRRPDLLK